MPGNTRTFGRKISGGAGWTANVADHNNVENLNMMMVITRHCPVVAYPRNHDDHRDIAYSPGGGVSTHHDEDDTPLSLNL